MNVSEEVYRGDGNAGKGGNAPWTTKEDQLLRDYAHLGAAGVQEILRRECGSTHTVRAIEMYASRARVSLRRLYECPECRKLASNLNRQSGLCPACNAQRNVDTQQALCELEEAEMAETRDEARIAELNRRYDALRQKRTRMRRRRGE